MLWPNWLSARAYSRRELREREKHRFWRNPDLVTVTSDNAGFGAVPTIDLLTHPRSYEVFTGYTPNCHYLTAADYESLRETWTLEEGVVYIVIN